MSSAPRTPLLGLIRVLAASALASAPAAAQTWFVDGAVTTGGAPLAGITVAAYTVAGAPVTTTTSGGSGQYRLALQTGSYRLLAYDLNGVWATTFYNAATSFETSAQIDLKASLAGVDFAMVRGFAVSGRVTRPEGSPLSGMVVAAYNADGTRRAHEKTSGSGTYTVLLPAGTYRLASYDDNLNYATSFYLNRPTYDSATPVAVAAAVTGVDFVLTPAGRVFGSASDRKTRLPVPGIVANAYTLTGTLVGTATTGANGAWAMGVPPGTLKFTAFDPAGGYAPSFYEDAATFASAPSFGVAAGQTLSGIDFLLGPPGPPSSPTTLYVPAAVNTPGANGTYFQTDLWITNSSDAALTVTATYLPSGQDNTGRPGLPVPVPAGGQVAYANVLASLFGATGAGSLMLSAPAPFLAASRTYNSASPPGTYGVGVAARPLSRSLARGVIPGLSNNSFFRSNVAVMNPQTVPLTVRFVLRRGDGTLLGEGTRTLAPLDWFQAGTIFSFLGVTTVESNAWLEVSSSTGSFFSYASVVDQTTGDGTVIEAAGN